MEHAILSVKRYGDYEEHDFEVPLALTVSQLAEIIVSHLGWDARLYSREASYHVRVEQTNRILLPQEILQAGQVEDGARLIFEPQGMATAAREPYARSRTAGDSPVTGWRSLGLDLPLEKPSENQPAPAEKPDRKFVWKEIDL